MENKFITILLILVILSFITSIVSGFMIASFIFDNESTDTSALEARIKYQEDKISQVMYMIEESKYPSNDDYYKRIEEKLLEIQEDNKDLQDDIDDLEDDLDDFWDNLFAIVPNAGY